jgi:hypothetical protein
VTTATTTTAASTCRTPREAALLELGGQELRDAAHDAAGAYVDERYPGDGFGDEPEQRVSAYISVLWEWVERARGE